MTADDVIRLLKLQPHPKEGGWFIETYRAKDAGLATPRQMGTRHASTAIYYLLTPTTFSSLHRLASDEVFHHYLGGPVVMLQLFPDGTGHEVILGTDLVAGQRPQVVVSHGVWQGSRLMGHTGFALLGCTVAPGFEYADYEQGQRTVLTQQYPRHADAIARLTTD